MKTQNSMRLVDIKPQKICVQPKVVGQRRKIFELAFNQKVACKVQILIAV